MFTEHLLYTSHCVKYLAGLTSFGTQAWEPEGGAAILVHSNLQVANQLTLLLPKAPPRPPGAALCNSDLHKFSLAH